MLQLKYLCRRRRYDSRNAVLPQVPEGPTLALSGVFSPCVACLLLYTYVYYCRVTMSHSCLGGKLRTERNYT